MPNEGSHCKSCGAAVLTDAADAVVCPACLMAAAGEWGRTVPEKAVPAPIQGECGDYLLERVLGRGGSGVVYLARKQNGQNGGPAVALKMLAAAHAAGPDELRRFRFEMESGAALDHPHLVKVIEVGDDTGVPFYVMEFATGGTLAETIPSPPQKDGVKAAVSILIKVARAVHFAHERGVLHRDLKPANILLDSRGEPKVADFGMGRTVHGTAGLTLTGTAVGTPAYMAPEQASGGVVTTAVDQYSLGAILFHQLTGRPPFKGSGPMEILHQVVAGEVTDPVKFAPWLDPDLSTICLTTLRRDPARRYTSVAAFADDLERWQRGEPVLARPLPRWAKVVRYVRRYPVTATLIATGCLAAAALIGIYVAGSEMVKKERNRALHLEAQARTAAAEAAEARDVSQLNTYAADVYLGFRALADGHMGQARGMLNRHIPPPGARDYRGFEWHALNQLCQGDDTAVWRDHTAAVTTVAFHSKENLIASASRDGRIIVREVPGGKVRLQLPHPDAPRELAELAVLALAAKRSEEYSALFVNKTSNLADMRMRSRTSSLGEIYTLAWSADGKSLASGGGGSFVRIWSIPEGALTGIIPVRTATQVAFVDGDSRVMVFAPERGQRDQYQLRIYTAHNLALEWHIEDLQVAHAVSPDGKKAAVTPTGSTEIQIMDLQTGKVSTQWDGRTNVKRLAFSDTGEALYGIDSSGGQAFIWNTATGQRTGTLSPKAGSYDLLLVGPGGRVIATNAGQTISSQAMATNSTPKFLRGHEDTVLALATSPDGHWLVSGGNDHTVRLWSSAGRPNRVPQNPSFPQKRPPPPLPLPAGIADGADAVWASGSRGYFIGNGARDTPMMFLPYSDTEGGTARRLPETPARYSRLIAASDGTLAAISWPRGVRFLAPGAPNWTPPLELCQGTVGPVVFSPDSQLVASGGDDNLISIRETRTNKLVTELRGHRAEIIDLAFSPDGKTLASSAVDGTLRLWHAPTWRELGTLHHGEILAGLEFASGGEALRGRTTDGIERIFGAAGK